MNNFNIGVLEPSVLEYKWKVNNFSSTNSAVVKDRLLSPIFSTKYGDNTVEWRLHLYPKGNKEESVDYLSIFVELVKGPSVTARVSLTILRKFDQKNNLMRTMGNQTFTAVEKCWGFAAFLQRSFVMDEKNRVLENDTLKILCKIDFNSTPIKLDDERDVEEEAEKPNHRLKEFDYFEKMFESEAFSDMTFVVEEKKIHAHKAILVSHSPVFEVMLQRYTKDKQEDTFEITGIKYEVMKELLRFMYVGKVNDLDEKASDLLIAADKYSVAGLKALCEEALYKNLGIDNALEYLNLAAVCDATVLKSQVIEFIASNLEDIVEKPEFELFGDLNSKVICEVVRAIAKKNAK